MRAFEELTYLGQVRRLRRLAESALHAYGLDGARLKLIAHAENATFRVDAPTAGPKGETDGPYVSSRFLLRVHRPGYQNAASIASELAWLTALRHDTDLALPEPVVTLEGKLLTQADAPGVPAPRICSLLRWMSGRFREHHPRPGHLEVLGRLMARLHDHADRWCPPADFVRPRWDWDGLFMESGTCGVSERETWELLSPPHRELFEAVTALVDRAMRALGESPDVFGLIHADLHLGNVLFSGREARPIDFDDCGFGHRIYDFAVVLHDYREEDDWPVWRDALLEGYARCRSMPEDQWAHLEMFMAARCVSLILWAVAQAQHNPGFRKHLRSWLDWAAGYARRSLDG